MCVCVCVCVCAVCRCVALACIFEVPFYFLKKLAVTVMVIQSFKYEPFFSDGGRWKGAYVRWGRGKGAYMRWG